MEIKVLGPGCAKCKAHADLIARALGEMGKEVTVKKIEDMREIVGFGVMTTPVVVIGREVVHKGTVPSHDEVLAWLG